LPFFGQGLTGPGAPGSPGKIWVVLAKPWRACRRGLRHHYFVNEKSYPHEFPIMILSPGETVHVIHRQFFEGDARRHFIGVV
jgi:hypothetical protein